MKHRLLVASVLVAVIVMVIAAACKSMEWHSDGYLRVAEPQEAVWVIRTSMPKEI